MGAEPTDQVHRRYWRWYVNPDSGVAVAREEFLGLGFAGRAALTAAIGRFRRHEELAGEVAKLTDTKDMWEIRVQVGSNPFRALFFYDTDIMCVCVSALYKNQRKLPVTDKKTAVARKLRWEEEGSRRRQAEERADRRRD